LFAFLLEPAQVGVQHWEARIQLGLILPCVIGSFLMLVVVSVSPESTAWKGGVENQVFLQNGSEYTWTWNEVRTPLIVAVVLSFAQQMTGINAIMNYAPRITKAAGLKPLLGNFLVMLWNCITSTASVPLSKRFDRRPSFLAGVALCLFACFLTGIPTFPGLCSDTVKHVLASLGIGIFILAFEIGMGPMFFMLATEMFPPAFRNTGCSFTNTVNLIFNLVINFGFPVAVEALAGGPSGNQDLGLAWVFVFFGGVGLVSVIFLYKFLRPWKEQDDL
jgi:MFS family permease